MYCTPLLALEELARDGDCWGFSDVIQHTTGEVDLVKVTDLFLVLLSSIVVKFAYETELEEYYSEEEPTSQTKSLTEETPIINEIEQSASDVQDSEDANLLNLGVESKTATLDIFKKANPFIDEIEQESNTANTISDPILEITDTKIEPNVSTWERFRETIEISSDLDKQTTHSEIPKLYLDKKLSTPVIMEEIEIESENSEPKPPTNPFLDLDNLETTTTTIIHPDAVLETNPFASVENLEPATIATSENAPFIHEDLIDLQTNTTTTDIDSTLNNCNLNQQIGGEHDPWDTLESVKDLLNSPLIQITQPRDVLCLYSSLSKLQLYDVITQHFDRTINKIDVSTIAQYSDCISNWSLWTFLPLPISSQLSNHLYTLSLALDSVKIPEINSVSITVPSSIQELSVSDTPPPPVGQYDSQNIEQCYVDHLTLINLLICLFCCQRC